MIKIKTDCEIYTKIILEWEILINGNKYLRYCFGILAFDNQIYQSFINEAQFLQILAATNAPN